MPDKLTKKTLHITVSKSIGEVSSLFYLPPKAKYIMVFAHGAGAGMNNRFMEEVSVSLAEKEIATLRFNFPYVEKGKHIPDSKPVSIAAVKAVVEKAAELCPDLPLMAGGKSFGGRMVSTAASEGLIPNVKKIVFFGFPLHPPGKPSVERAEHLYKVNTPMLFLQGTRDALATMDLLKPVCRKLGYKAKLVLIEGADHTFNVPKDSGLKHADVIELMCNEVKRWVSSA